MAPTAKTSKAVVSAASKKPAAATRKSGGAGKVGRTAKKEKTGSAAGSAAAAAKDNEEGEDKDAAEEEGEDAHHAPAPAAKKAHHKPAAVVAKAWVTPSEAGQVFSMGDGMAGQLGLGEDKLVKKRPATIPELAGAGIVQLGVGGMHSLALGKDGKVWSWGNNDRKALGRPGEGWTAEVTPLPAGVVAAKVATTDTVALVLTTDGRVFGWGSFRDSTGFIGFAPGNEMQETPAEIEFFRNKGVVDIATGSNHCIALTGSGEVYGWGSAEVGELGRRIISARTTDTRIPHALNFPKREKIVQIFCGRCATFAVTVNGDVYASGLNQYGQLGLGTVEQVASWTLIKEFKNLKIKQIVGGTHHTIVLTEDGKVLTVGRNDNSQLGRGTDTDYETELALVTGDLAKHEALQVAAGDFFSLAVTKDGSVYSWGFGEMHQLGHGEDQNESTPRKLEAKTTRIIQAGAGGQHSILLGVKIDSAY